ncbi:MAG TPA: MauE/DoxX family redox-associated membrane protein [Advenella sp.]|nr:MauE/DoxX family redox-associated membrane protein [Advenella sp.]
MNMISNPLLFMLAKFFLVFVLIAAALPKLRDRDEFHGVVVNYRILPDVLAFAFARMLPYLELSLAALLLVNVATAYAGVFVALLLLSFAIAIGINLARGRTHIDCGCLRGAERGNGIGLYQFVRPVVLAIAALYVAYAASAGVAATLGETVLALAAAAMTAILYTGADMLSSLSPASSNNS